MLKICLVLWEFESQYAYKRYVYKKTCTYIFTIMAIAFSPKLSHFSE